MCFARGLSLASAAEASRPSLTKKVTLSTKGSAEGERRKCVVTGADGAIRGQSPVSGHLDAEEAFTS